MILDETWLPEIDFSRERIRKAASQIVPGVWVGDRIDAEMRWVLPNWTVIDVRESDTERDPAHVVRIPLLRKDTDYKAGAKALLEITEAIDRERAKGQEVLVHCWQGIERSPLSVAGWLVMSQGYTLYEAYRLLMQRRGVANRRNWLTKRARNTLEGTKR